MLVETVDHGDVWVVQGVVSHRACYRGPSSSSTDNASACRSSSATSISILCRSSWLESKCASVRQRSVFFRDSRASSIVIPTVQPRHVTGWRRHAVAFAAVHNAPSDHMHYKQIVAVQHSPNLEIFCVSATDQLFDDSLVFLLRSLAGSRQCIRPGTAGRGLPSGRGLPGT